jgi:biotin operon repressor
MYRDDLILQGIEAGATSTATLAERTGMSPATVWRGLQRLMGSGHVFSPVRGVYRVTASGAAALGLSDGEPPAVPEQPTLAAGDQPLVETGSSVTPGSRQSGSGDRLDAPDHCDADGAPAAVSRVGWFDWRAFGAGVVVAIGGLVLGRLVLALLAIRRAGPPPSEAPPGPAQASAYQSVWPGFGPA